MSLVHTTPEPVFEYDNELWITVQDFSVEYSGCGSHAMDITFKIDGKEINEFLKRIGVHPIGFAGTFPPEKEGKE